MTLHFQQRRPPYAEGLRKLRGGLVVVLVGDGAWCEGKLRQSNDTVKNYLVLPLGVAANKFTWPVAGQMVMVKVCGHLKPATQQEISKALQLELCPDVRAAFYEVLYRDFSLDERAALAGALLRDGAIACQFEDTCSWHGHLPKDSLYYTDKKPALLARAAG